MAPKRASDDVSELSQDIPERLSRVSPNEEHGRIHSGYSDANPIVSTSEHLLTPTSEIVSS